MAVAKAASKYTLVFTNRLGVAFSAKMPTPGFSAPCFTGGIF